MMLAAILALLFQATPGTSSPPAFAPTPLNVPFVAQTDDRMCGGAAVAMILRYWGVAHADPKEFAPLVDPRAGGIAASALIDAVVNRGWRVQMLDGSLDRLTTELTAGHPIVVMIGRRAAPYHYVVVTAVDRTRVMIHDPSWGPSRQLPIREFVGLWKATGYWAMLVLPGASPGFEADAVSPAVALARGSTVAAPITSTSHEPQGPSACDLLLDDAIRDLRLSGLSAADDVLLRVGAICPQSSGVLRELAGVRFAQHRWADAVALATQAIARDPSDEYAWDVLGSARFMSGNVSGALDDWNRIGRPRIDLVYIAGLRHQRYASIANVLDLPVNALLTDERWRLAQRRLDALPGIAGSRLDVQPTSDGYVAVDAAVSERATWSRAPLNAIDFGERAAVNREAALTVPGPTGQGEIWSAGWRWWEGRPNVAFGFSAPQTGRFQGVWRVDASWEKQSYAIGEAGSSSSSLIVESRAGGGISFSDWASPNLRYSATAGLDAWTSQTTRHSLFVGGLLERRLSDDRLSANVGHTSWLPVDGAGAAFHSTEARITFQSSAALEGARYLADIGGYQVSQGAPLALWNGAGEGQRGTVLLRAHPLLVDGIVTTRGGAIFGPVLSFSNVEAERWISSSLPIGIALAAFADFGYASRAQLDIGGGVRIHLPGSDGALRVDIARGALDGAKALTLGWQPAFGLR